MPEFDWLGFSKGEGDNPFLLGRLAPLICSVLNCPDTRVFVASTHLLEKCYGRHGLEPAHFEMMLKCLDQGIVLQEPGRTQSLTFIYEDNMQFQKAFEIVVKVTGDRDELWVSTFHMIRSKDLRRRIKKARIVREQIR